MTQYFKDLVACLKEAFKRESEPDSTAFIEQEGSAPSYEPMWISDYLAQRTQELLRSFCDANTNREGLVYWAGIPIGRGGVVTTLVVPNASAGPGFVETSALENAAVIAILDRMELVLIGQAHSHPPGAGTHHSLGDDSGTFSPFEGAISVVVAAYAREEERILDGWGVHRFMSGRYQRIASMDRHKHLRIVASECDRRSKLPIARL